MAKVSIEVPDWMDERNAQTCFAMGMRVYSEANSAGLCVAYGVEKDRATALKMMTFKGDYAFAVSRFCEGVGRLERADEEKNLAIMRDVGSAMLKELQERNGGRGKESEKADCNE